MHMLQLKEEESDSAEEHMVRLCEEWAKGQTSFSDIIRWSENIGVSTSVLARKCFTPPLAIEFWKQGVAEPHPEYANHVVSLLHDIAVQRVLRVA